MDKKKYSIKDICKLFWQIKDVSYPPSGKYYEFKDYEGCEDWNLGVRIMEILEEMEETKDKKIGIEIKVKERGQ